MDQIQFFQQLHQQVVVEEVVKVMVETEVLQVVVEEQVLWELTLLVVLLVQEVQVFILQLQEHQQQEHGQHVLLDEGGAVAP